MLVGILFKVSAAPFHVWTPDVYEGAPSPVVALLSTAPKAAAFALLLRVVYEMFPSLHALWAPLLWVVAVLSMTVGNLAALRQQNVKRMLAYSSIAHAGYLLAAFAGIGTIGIAAASFYTAAYAAMNVGIFAVVTLVSGYDEHFPSSTISAGSSTARRCSAACSSSSSSRSSAFPSPAASSASSTPSPPRWTAAPSRWPSSACSTPA